MAIQTKTTVNMKGLKSIISKLETLNTYDAEAGFDDSIHPKHGAPMSYIAERNEYGDSDDKLPSRPFMRVAAEQGQVGVGYVFTREYRRLLAGKTTSRNVMAKVAKEEAEWISDVIKNNSFHANAKLTLSRKTGSQPLVDSSYMADNVKSKAVKKTVED